MGTFPAHSSFSPPPPMACTSVRVVCCASGVGTAHAPHVLAKVTLFLLPATVSAIAGAIAGGRLPLARLLLDALAENDRVHFLDKRMRARKAMAAATRAGDVELLQWIYDAFHCLLDESIVSEAVAAGRHEALAWLMTRLRQGPRQQ